MSGICAYSSRVKSVSSTRMLPPKIARQIAATISLGTKVSVCSLIDVAACTMPSSTPMMSTGSSSGAEASARIHSRSEEHTSELQSLMRISYAVFCLKKKTYRKHDKHNAKTQRKDSNYK